MAEDPEQWVSQALIRRLYREHFEQDVLAGRYTLVERSRTNRVLPDLPTGSASIVYSIMQGQDRVGVVHAMVRPDGTPATQYDPKALVVNGVLYKLDLDLAD